MHLRTLALISVYLFLVTFSISSARPSAYCTDVKDVDKDLMCEGCKLAVKYIKWLVEEGYPPSTIANEIETVCKDLKINSRQVCDGITAMFAPQVAYVFRNMNHSADVVCDMFLGNCLPTNPINNWTVGVPSGKPPVQEVKKAPADAPKLTVLYLSDLHFDDQYKPGSNALCSNPLCCREDGSKPANESAKAGFWGDYRNCDSPRWTIENMLEHIMATEVNIDYVIWAGDLTPHNIWKQTHQEHINYVKLQTEVFKKYFDPKKTIVYPAVGNHESVPVNTFSLPNATHKFKMDWLYDTFAKNWIETGLPNSTEKTLKFASFYAVDHVKDGLRILSVNMNYCNNLNIWLLDGATDPGNQLKWLIEQLKDAEDKKIKVHIIGHIQPGSTDCLKAWSYTYYKIVNRFESTIRGQFFGHTHNDMFQLFFNQTDLSKPHRAVSVAYTGPSVTPFSELNPGYRIFEIDGRTPKDGGTYAILNHRTYFLNLTEANLSNNTKWELEYSAKDAYKMDQLEGKNWYQVVQELGSDSKLFDKFYMYKYKMHPTKSCPETSACRKNNICSLLTGRSYDPDICKHLKINYYDHVIYNYASKQC